MPVSCGGAELSPASAASSSAGVCGGSAGAACATVIAEIVATAATTATTPAGTAHLPRRENLGMADMTHLIVCAAPGGHTAIGGRPGTSRADYQYCAGPPLWYPCERASARSRGREAAGRRGA